MSSSDIGTDKFASHFKKRLSSASSLAFTLDAPSATVSVILEAFALGPESDLRQMDSDGAVFRSEVASAADIKVGIALTGKVVNVVDFGAFVDVGLGGKSGLVHVSKYNGFGPLRRGQVVRTKVVSIQGEKIGLAMEGLGKS